MKSFGKWILLVLLFLSGCSSTISSNFLLSPENVHSVSCVAVLPFKNKTPDPNAGNVMADILSIDLMKHRNFNVMDRMEVERVLRERDISTPDGISPDDAAGMGIILGVQAVFTGEVTQYIYVPSILPTEGAVPTIQLSLSLIDTATGQVIWAGSGMFTPSGLLAKGTSPLTDVAQEGIENLLAFFYQSIGPGYDATSKICWYDPNTIFSRVIVAQARPVQPKRAPKPSTQQQTVRQQRVAVVQRLQVQVPPAKVSILNASGNPRASMLVGVTLIKDKINVVNVSTEKYAKPATIVYYRPDYYVQAMHIARLLRKIPQLVQSSAYKWDITIVIGRDLK